jgi:hypothetical protein
MPNLSYRKPRIPDLGRVFGLVYRANEKANELYNAIGEDLRAFHAPSECSDIAYLGCDKIVQDAVDTAVAITGMTWREILDEIHARTGGRWLNWLMYQSLIPTVHEDN